MDDFVVFDIETKETFDEVGGYFPDKLTPSLVGLYSFNENRLLTFTEEEFPTMWPYFEQAALLVGFNSDHFDIPILAKLHPTITEIQSLDMLAVIKQSAGHRVKLDSLAEATLGNQKSADGLEAIAMFRDGRIDELRAYCAQDVAITRDVYIFGKQHGYVLATSFAGPKKITVDFNPPLKQRSAATLSLGF